MTIETAVRRVFPQARQYFEQLLCQSPDDYRVLNNYGAVLNELGEFQQAQIVLQRACAFSTRPVEAFFNLALSALRAGDVEQALNGYRQVLALDPDHVDAHAQLGMLRLAEGDFSREAWTHYQYQRRSSETTKAHVSLELPEWDGTPAPDKTVLVVAEQGLGDQIMFASCLGDLSQDVGQVILACEPRLTTLFSRSFPHVEVIGFRSPEDLRHPALVDRCDAQAGITALPLFYRNTLSDFPRHRGYLRADPHKVAGWYDRLQQLPGALKVGISWQGGTPQTNSRVRSIDLDQWIALLKLPGVDWISLQYTDCTDQLAALQRNHGIVVHHWQQAIDDYDETAALVKSLDVVISVTTSIIHLSGALGQRVWVLVNRRPQWRYLRQGTHMPWYPSATLIRQPESGDWQEVFAHVRQRLVCISSSPPSSRRGGSG